MVVAVVGVVVAVAAVAAAVVGGPNIAQNLEFHFQHNTFMALAPKMTD